MKELQIYSYFKNVNIEICRSDGFIWENRGTSGDVGGAH